MKLEDILEAIAAEPELEGEMPEVMRECVQKALDGAFNMEFFIKSMRLAVRGTKEKITERILNLAEKSD